MSRIAFRAHYSAVRNDVSVRFLGYNGANNQNIIETSLPPRNITS